MTLQQVLRIIFMHVTIAAEKADTALQFTLQIRNKIMDAYTEIMRMQI